MKFRIFLSVLMIMTTIMSAYSKNIDQATAEKVAKNYYFQQVNTFENPIDFNDVVISDVSVEKYNGTEVMYVINIVDGGFVLVSTEQAMVPVLGINTTVGARFDIDARGPEYKYFVTEIMAVVENIAVEKAEPSPEVLAQWNLFSTDNSETLLNTKDDVEIGPLLTTTWNQDYPYNYYAPLASGGPGGRCYAGCVATAMSTIMHYWSWPIQGQGQCSYYCSPYGVQTANFGETTYQWESMSNSVSAANEETIVKSVALIQYHAGVSVQMQYSPDGSGAYSPSVPGSLLNYFRYPNASYMQKTNATTWENTLIQQITSKYVVYHSGCDTDGCHAWNCDGYRSISGVNTFHHNFNWGGSYNDWYTAANPSGYSSSQAMVKNFYPPTDQYPIYASGHRVLTEKYARVSDGSGPVNDYLAGASATWLIAPQSEYDSIEYITLTWEKFELGNNDYIKIYDGEDQSATLVGTYSGTELPETFQSSGNKLFIEFASTGTAPGFIFTYLAKRHKYCTSMNNITEPYAEISSNPEDKYYTPSTMCRWQTKWPFSTGGVVHFNYVDTYDENDFVTVYDIGTEELYTFYGNEIPTEDINISEKGCLITFKTDAMNTEGKGFSLTFTDNNIGVENYEISNLEIYPNPAQDMLNISFNANGNKNVNCQVVNIAGSVVYRNSFSGNENQSVQIDVSNLPVGIYFVNFKYDKGTITKKVVIE